MVKGAPEDIVGLCVDCEDAGAPARADRRGDARAPARRVATRWRARAFACWASRGATCRSDHPHAVVGDETELVFAGFAAFLDPPKASAGAALAALRASGVAIKIVTGDSELVTQHICAQLNMPVDGVLTGNEIAQLDDEALRARVEAANLFCRVNPAQKDRVILALKARGHVVGYLGDGINDAPSLHSADVGISVDIGGRRRQGGGRHDPARARPARCCTRACSKGRRTFANIMKYIMMGTSSNFGNMFSMAGASLFLPFLPMLPTQILLNNMLYDISEVPIPLDRRRRRGSAQPARAGHATSSAISCW